MTNYVRFFHLQMQHCTFLAIESTVTLGTLLLCLLLPNSYTGWFPWQGFRRFAQHRVRACLTVMLLSALGRLALLPIEPFAIPNVHDEFSYLLASDTLAHGRLANPTPALWHHFEQYYVLMQPTYSSRYGAAQPLFMAFGQLLFSSPRVGILLSMGLAAASVCWMLQAYLPPEWAFAGGLLAVVRMSWFSYFGNSYWGGSVAILGGCLLLGAAPRLARSMQPRDGLLMASGMLLLANARPFEGAVLALPLGLYTLWTFLVQRANPRVWLPGLTLLGAGAAWTAYYCYRVTGHLTFPWALYWQQWSMSPPFLFVKPNYAVHYQFMDQLVFNRDYEMAPYLRANTAIGWFAEILVKAMYQWLFFVFPAVTPALVGVIPTLRCKRNRVLIAAFTVASVGFISETWLQAQYTAVAAGVFYLVLVNGLRLMRVCGRRNVLWLKLLRGTVAAVVIMSFVRLIVVPVNTFPPNWGSRTEDIPGYQDITGIMAAKPGKHLVMVRYRPNHFWGYSWINNGYDIPTQRIIWARDTEPFESNQPLLCEFKDRQIWLLIPPEKGFVPPLDRTARWDEAVAGRFLAPYPGGCE